MKRALVNDLAQRLLTLNKYEQRASLRRRLAILPRHRNPSALDFGCGTGLFLSTIMRAGYSCTGLDIDPELTAYAARLHPAVSFANRLEELAATQFDLILANCCFHHIPDGELDAILRRFRDLLKPGGRLLVIDILAQGNPSPLHGWFMQLEQGRHVRPEEPLREIVARHFSITGQWREYGGVFSITARGNPFGNERLILECV